MERWIPSQKSQPADYGWTLPIVLITLMVIAGYWISTRHPYAPGDRIGYNLGLAGGLMMLTLLFYPARKRLRFMKNWGSLPTWFMWHMVFGILGPALILLHSTFQIRSINAGAALVCVMLVAGSGIFGRFFYARMNFGLSGRLAPHQQLLADLDKLGDAKSIFSFAPEISQQLAGFRDSALKSMGKLDVWCFLTVGIRARLLGRVLVCDLEEAIYVRSQGRRWGDAQLRRLDEHFEQNIAFIESYLKYVRDVARLAVHERLFSWWHVFHVPLAYILVFSAIWHVIAVHMY